MNLGRYPSYWARTRGDHEALVCGEQRLTWRDVDAKVSAIAGGLRAMGVQPGDRVAIFLPNSVEWCLVYFAILVAGAIVVPVNPLFGTNEIRSIIDDSDSRIVITDSELHAELLGKSAPCHSTEHCQILFWDRRYTSLNVQSLRDIIRQNLPPPLVPVDCTQLAAIGYTSGTTGLPKGVMFTHYNIHCGVQQTVTVCSLGCDDRFLVMAPLPFTGGYIVSLTPVLLTGGCAVILAEPDTDLILQTLVHEAITVMQGVPILWDRISRLAAFTGADLGTLKLAVCGGAPVSRHLMAVYRKKSIILRQGYACSESSGSACLSYPALAAERPELCGPPLPGIAMMIADDHGNPVDTGSIGEICLSGPQIMTGYWRNEAETSATLRNGWLYTGDLGRVDDKYNLEIVDRKKNMIVSGGVNIYPAEVERAMAPHLEGADFAVFGVDDPVWGERVIAAIAGGKPPGFDSIKQDIRRILGGVKAPKTYVFWAQGMPKTATGKIARKELASRFLADQTQPAPCDGRDGSEGRGNY